eukprot:1028208_1
MGPLPAARLCKSIKSDTHSSRYEPQMEQLSEKDVPLLFSDHLTRQFGHVFDQASAGGHLVKRVLKFTQKLRKITQTYTNELDALVSYEQQKVLAIKDNSECKLATLGTLSQFQAMAEG